VQSAIRPTPYKISTSQPRQYRREGKGKSNKGRASASLTLALIQRFQSNSRQSGSAVCDKSAIVFVAIHSTAHPGLIDPTFQRVSPFPKSDLLAYNTSFAVSRLFCPPFPSLSHSRADWSPGDFPFDGHLLAEATAANTCGSPSSARKESRILAPPRGQPQSARARAKLRRQSHGAPGIKPLNEQSHFDPSSFKGD
jgi:hypothetical protein